MATFGPRNGSGWEGCGGVLSPRADNLVHGPNKQWYRVGGEGTPPHTPPFSGRKRPSTRWRAVNGPFNERAVAAFGPPPFVPYGHFGEGTPSTLKPPPLARAIFGGFVHFVLKCLGSHGWHGQPWLARGGETQYMCMTRAPCGACVWYTTRVRHTVHHPCTARSHGRYTSPPAWVQRWQKWLWARPSAWPKAVLDHCTWVPNTPRFRVILASSQGSWRVKIGHFWY